MGFGLYYRGEPKSVGRRFCDKTNWFCCARSGGVDSSGRKKKGGTGFGVGLGDVFHCCGWGEIPLSKAAETKDFDSRFGSGSGLGTPVPINSLCVRRRQNLRRRQVRRR